MIRRSFLYSILAVMLTIWLLTDTRIAYAQSIKEKDIRAHIAILASDAFEGREPGTEGERKTIAYIADEWSRAGLKPAGPSGSWYQPVPLRSLTAGRTQIAVFKGNKKLAFDASELVTINSTGDINLSRIPIVFAGLGVDSKGQATGDVKDKLVLMLTASAPHLPQSMASPSVRKQVLLDAGAAAVLYIAEPSEWAVLRNQYIKPTMELNSQASDTSIEGAIGASAIVGLLNAAGQDWDKMRKVGIQPVFVALPMGLTANLESFTTVQNINSYNVIGKIKGRKAGAGAVFFMGHWDHLGICGEVGTSDRICNGAVDNASGIAVMIEVARRMSRKKHDRDIYFLATTAEEKGLLGAYGYMENPALPPNEHAVILNLDMVAIDPVKSDVAIVGHPSANMQNIVKNIAARQKRKLVTPASAAAFITRQDGYVFQKQNIPAFIIGGAFSDVERLDAFLNSHYHDVDDELYPNTQLGGAVKDAELHIMLGQYFASTRKYRGETLLEAQPTGAKQAE